MPRVVSVFLAAVLVSVVCEAQTPPRLPPGFPQPPRDTAAAPTGTATIRGHVFDASNGRPLRKVQLRVSSPELREGRVAFTDNSGVYEIKNLAAGRYQLSASKGSFVSLSYGQTRPFEQGKPLEVRDAQLLDKVDFSLPHGAIVTGRVVDEVGEPTSEAQVSIQRYQYANGRRQLSTVRGTPTNDIGEYRLYGMPPGQYFVSATLRSFNLSDVSADDRSGYAPTYYPGTTNVNDAQRVTLGIGQTLSEINIALSPTRMVRITGTAVDSQGKPMQGLIMVMATAGNSINSSLGGQIKPDGSFAVGNVAPGEYALRALAINTASQGLAPEIAQADVTVAGEDINDVRLIGVKPSSVTGRVIPPAGQTTSLGQLQLTAQPKLPGALFGGGGGRVNDDGTFELMVPPGAAYIRMNPVAGFAGTRIKSVRLNGVDVTDTGTDFKPNESVSGVEVELTTQFSTLSGVVTDTRGNSVKDYSVVIFPRDKERWGLGSRYLNFGRPDQDGRYKALNLPTGDYYAIALDYVEQGANTDPEFLDRIKDRATEFSIDETETKLLDLRLVTGL